MTTNPTPAEIRELSHAQWDALCFLRRASSDRLMRMSRLNDSRSRLPWRRWSGSWSRGINPEISRADVLDLVRRGLLERRWNHPTHTEIDGKWFEIGRPRHNEYRLSRRGYWMARNGFDDPARTPQWGTVKECKIIPMTNPLTHA